MYPDCLRELHMYLFVQVSMYELGGLPGGLGVTGSVVGMLRSGLASVMGQRRILLGEPMCGAVRMRVSVSRSI